jgi:hypothetical protein
MTIESPPTAAPSPRADSIRPDGSSPSRGSRVGFFLAQGAVIVVSVLFALAADRVMMGLDDAARERRDLEGLLQDMSAVEDAFRSSEAAAARRDSAASTILATIRGESPTVDGLDLARDLMLSSWVMDVPVARLTWDDMLATGRMGLLENEDLRAQLAAFYRSTDETHRHSTEWGDQVRPYDAVTRELFDPELFVAVGNEIIFGDSIPAALAPDGAELARQIRDRKELASVIGNVVLINKVAQRSYANFGDRARKLEDMIRSELEGG